ncbi:primosomal protein N' [bacterium SCSIO 12741]|nr:primosomal protein N' [bacterium SCSIO 12741]
MVTLFVDVILPLPLNRLYTYRVPRGLNDQIQERTRVVVQFGKSKLYSALVARVHEHPPQDYQAKYIDEILDDAPIIYPEQLKFWEWMSDYYLCSMGEVMLSALPSGLNLSSQTILQIHPDFDGDFSELNDKEYLVSEALENQEKLTLQEISEILGQKTVMPLVKRLIEQKVAISEEDLKLKYKPQMVDWVRLTPSCQQEEVLQEKFDELSRAPKQLEVLMTYIKLSGWHTANPKPVKKTELYQAAEASLAQVKSLVEKGVLEVYAEELGRVGEFEDADETDFPLNEHQEKALEELRINLNEKPVTLLHGVTSSGKTELYIQLARECIRQGKQVLYLVPEIALTTQLVNRLKHRFGNRMGVYHSRFNVNERVEIWNRALADDGYDVVIGARSTLFVPMPRLGLIIVDEEHETSFKQFDPAPRYHARDSAVVLASIYKAQVLLGSATPAIETYRNAQTGKFGLVSVKKRHGNIQLPEIFVDDLTKAYKRKEMKANLGPMLFQAMEEALENKEQIILFRNRRGFSPTLRCQTCGWVPQCKNCDISLTYHKYRDQLSCHYCGFHQHVPHTCPACGGHEIKLAGFGTERVEEDLSLLFPKARIARMDLDTTRNKNSYQRMLSDFEAGDTDILVGTQMITKGLDFDRVSLVGILSADNMLHYPDFRAFERSYHLMAQVAGRAGRKNKRGKVIIQSFEPEHFIIRKVIDNDYEGMVKDQLVHRRQFNYPPYSRIVLITLKHRSRELNQDAARQLARILRGRFGDRILGPETPAIARIRNLYHENILIKLSRDSSNAQLKIELLELLDEFRKSPNYKAVRLVINVDPL